MVNYIESRRVPYLILSTLIVKILRRGRKRKSLLTLLKFRRNKLDRLSPPIIFDLFQCLWVGLERAEMARAQQERYGLERRGTPLFPKYICKIL